MTASLHHRPAERRELKRLFELGKSVQMLAPRRIGKTWLMRAVATDLGAAGWQCIAIDVEGMGSEVEFLRALCRAIEATQPLRDSLLSHFKQRLKQVTASVENGSLAQALTQIDPAQFAETLVEGLDAQGGKTLILIDELSLFVLDRASKDPDATRAFLYLLRRLRQGHPNVRWFFTGSVGLDAVARRLGLEGALIDMNVFGLEPFDIEAARSHVAELATQGRLRQRFDFAEGAFEHLAAELGWLSPYYLEHLANRVQPSQAASAGRGALATIADVDAAFSDLLRPINRTYFAAWGEHVDKNFPVDAPRLRAILDALCDNADGETEATLLARLGGAGMTIAPRSLKDLMIGLANDGLVAFSANRWRFRSGLVRRYWAEYQKA